MLAGLAALGTLVVAVVAAAYAKRQVDTARQQVQGARDQLEESRRLRDEQEAQAQKLRQEQQEHALSLAREQGQAALQLSREQGQQAQQLRDEQAAPVVVVDFEPSEVWGNFINLVIENVGQTLARDVKLTFTPPLRSSQENKDGGFRIADSVLLKQGIPAMAPRKRIVTLFDVSHDRVNTNLPMTYDVKVEFTNWQAEPRPPLQYVLDLNFRYGLRRVEPKGIHHVAKSLSEIERSLRKWTNHGNGLRVWLRDEDARIFEENWQEEHGGDFPSLGRPYPAGRPAPSWFDRLREPLWKRLYWTTRNSLIERPSERRRLRERMEGRPDIASMLQERYDALEPWWSRLRKRARCRGN